MFHEIGTKITASIQSCEQKIGKMKSEEQKTTVEEFIIYDKSKSVNRKRQPN